MVDYNILDQLKNQSNESVSIINGACGKSDHNNGTNMLINNSSFTSNFRPQVPTGAKLIIGAPSKVVITTNPEAMRKKHSRYQANISHTGVVSPTGAGL